MIAPVSMLTASRGGGPIPGHVVVVGCGRVGSALALNLHAAGHTVAIIDRRSEAFGRLGADFAGRTIVGIGFDRDRLKEAGIERAGALAAVTSGDNSNILIARVARETFGIDKVVARIWASPPSPRWHGPPSGCCAACSPTSRLLSGSTPAPR
jgi:voltage-gated potassium channel Kch